MRTVTGTLTIGLCLSIASCAKPTDDPAAFGGAGGLRLPADAARAAESIDVATLQAVVDALADDAIEGRGPATDGDRRARLLIAEALADAGVEPGAMDGGWEQPFELRGFVSHLPERWSFTHDGGSLELDWWSDYIAWSGVLEPEVSVDDAEIVFVGYGIEAPEERWDDFKGTDLRGKVLLMLNNDPDQDPQSFAGERRLYYGRWTYKYESAARQGAAGAIIIHTAPSAGYPWSVVQSSWTGEQFELPGGQGPRLGLAGWLTEDAAQRLVGLAGLDLAALQAGARTREFQPVPLGVTTSIRFTNTLTDGARSANVLGFLPGRDPALRDEVVVFTAHHDHLGIGEPDETGDAIYNGARDNASGVASVVAVAKAFASLAQPPRRSALFLLVGAEEQGLLGSRYFAENPTVHPGRIAANINADSPNVFGRTRDVGVIGRGKSSLEDLLVEAAALQDRIVVEEPEPDKGYYYRSDQFNFAKIGVPALYFKAGTDFIGRSPGWGRENEAAWRGARYHQPSDQVYEDWDLEGLVEDTRLAFYVGLAVAENPELPRWRPGDEFESIRQRMRAEIGGAD